MKVWPMKSGTTVQSRAQVLIGSRRPRSSMRSTRVNKRGSTYGPFFNDRLIGSFLYYFGAKCGPGRRRRRIAALEGLRFLRVFPPLANTPVGLHGCRPPDVRPSPPPIGWLTGFMDVPR